MVGLVGGGSDINEATPSSLFVHDGVSVSLCQFVLSMLGMCKSTPLSLAMAK